ncbi:MAG: hypothetical protein QW613_07635 [Thermoprotei archaeon]
MITKQHIERLQTEGGGEATRRDHTRFRPARGGRGESGAPAPQIGSPKPEGSFDASGERWHHTRDPHLWDRCEKRSVACSQEQQ